MIRHGVTHGNHIVFRTGSDTDTDGTLTVHTHQVRGRVHITTLYRSDISQTNLTATFRHDQLVPDILYILIRTFRTQTQLIITGIDVSRIHQQVLRLHHLLDSVRVDT